MIDYSKLKTKWQGEGFTVGEFTGEGGGNLERYLGLGELCGKFYGVNTFIEFLNREMKKPKSSDYDSSTHYDSDFNKFRTYEETMKTFTENPSSVANFDENDLKILGGDSAGTAVEYDITGDFIDMSRYVEGIPESFGSMYDGNPRSKRMNITITGFFSCMVSESKINKRALRVKRLVDWLESNQIRCQVTYLFSNSNWHTEIVVKTFDEGFDINDLAITSHSDFFRRLQFRFGEWSKTIGWGYGSPRDFWNAYNKSMLENEYNNEFGLMIGSEVDGNIDGDFDRLEDSIYKSLIEETESNKSFEAILGSS